MKKSTIATLIMFFIVIPATLYLGTRLPGRSYYLTSTLLIVELMIPVFMAFEGRKPQARELVVIAVMCAIAVVARVAIPIPHFKPIFAIVILSAVAFGPESGFMIGAIGAFASNFFYGQGAYTPWQMFGYGAAGLLAGLLYQKGIISRKKLPLAIFGFFCCVLWVGPLLDSSSVFLATTEVSLAAAIPFYISGLPVNAMQGLCTFITIFFFGEPLLEKLDRVKKKYGMMEA